MKVVPAEPHHSDLVKKAFHTDREIRPKTHVSYLAKPEVSDFHCQRLLERLQDCDQEPGIQLFVNDEQVQAIAGITSSEWHQTVFGVPYHKIQPFYCFRQKREDIQSIVQWLRSIIKSHEAGVYSTRLETHQANLIYEMIRAGFVPVGTSIRMVHSINRHARIDKIDPVQYDNLIVREFENQDLGTVQNIGRSGHTHSHFSCEARFSQSQVQQIFTEWIEKCVHGLAQKVLVAEKEDQIAGFAILLTTSSLEPYINKRIGVIDFIVVDPRYQGSGVGRALLQGSFAWFASRVDLIELRTMADNLPAIRFYENNGFRILSSDQYVHFWND